MLSENRHQESISRGSSFAWVQILGLTLPYSVPVSNSVACLRFLTWKSDNNANLPCGSLCKAILSSLDNSPDSYSGHVLLLFSLCSFCGNSNTDFRGSDDLGIGEARGSSGAGWHVSIANGKRHTNTVVCIQL